MARVRFEIEFPTLTVDDLRALVVANDETHSDDDPIAYHEVTAADVLSLWFAGDFPHIPRSGEHAGTEGIEDVRRENEVMLVGEEYVHVNEMTD